jgi:PPOX class probable F420-dependent enzyme
VPAIEGRVKELLEAPNFCHVGTLGKDGAPRIVPVWVDTEDGRVVLNSAEGRGWVKNVERDPRITCTISNSENPYEYVTIRGRVVEKTTDGADEHIDAMAKKYMGVDSYPFRTPTEQRVIFRIEPEYVNHNNPG